MGGCGKGGRQEGVLVSIVGKRKCSYQGRREKKKKKPKSRDLSQAKRKEEKAGKSGWEEGWVGG